MSGWINIVGEMEVERGREGKDGRPNDCVPPRKSSVSSPERQKQIILNKNISCPRWQHFVFSFFFIINIIWRPSSLRIWIDLVERV